MEDYPIYRFVDFFELYEMLFHNKLKLSKLSTFQDKNEALGQVAASQADFMYRHTLKSNLQLQREHNSVRHNTYATCWSLEPEMVAMWALYSSDSTSIRVKTTYSKLNATIEALNKKIGWFNYTNEVSTRRMVSWNYQTKKVKYANFVDLNQKTTELQNEFKVYCKEKLKSNPDYFTSRDWIEDYLNHSNKLAEVYDDKIFIKDSSYLHENEIRAVIWCGVRNDVTHEEFLKDDTFMVNMFSRAEPNELPNYIFADITNNFIDEICFDPRMPQHKLSVFSDIIQNCKVPVVKSVAFGCHIDDGVFDLGNDEIY